MRSEQRLIEAVFEEIIADYNFSVRGINETARGTTGRAYGGVVRAGKGKLVEVMAEKLLRLAWETLGQASDRLTISHERVRIPLKPDYLGRIKDPRVRNHIAHHLDRYYYGLKTDIHVRIGGTFVLAIECNAYTENAMLEGICANPLLFHDASSDRGL